MKILYLLLFLSLSALGKVNTDTQAWANINSLVNLTPDWQLYLEFQPRLLDHGRKHGTSLYRTAFGKNLTKNLSLWLGYSFIERTSPTYRHEDRPYPQLLHLIDLDDRFRLINRTRFEMRYFRGSKEGAYRLRHLVRLQYKLGEGPWGLVLSEEWFWNSANHAPSGTREGFDENRVFLGFSYSFGKGRQHMGELGYMNRYVNGVSSDQRSDILALQMTFRY